MGALRRQAPRKADIDRAIKAVTDAGMNVTSVELGPDGSIRVLTGPAAMVRPTDDLDAWRAARDARKNKGT